MQRTTIGGWKPLALFPFIEAQAVEDRSTTLPGLTLLAGKRYRLTANPLRKLRDNLIAPRLTWDEPEPGTLKAPGYMILDATTPMEGIYCFKDNGTKRPNGKPKYQWFATTHSLARAQRICERHAHRAAKR